MTTKLLHPMLAASKVSTPDRVLQAFGTVQAERKYDGMRLRIYRKDGEFCAWSRPSAKLPEGSEYTDRVEHLFEQMPHNYDNYLCDVELFTGSWGQTMSLARKLDLPPEERRKLKALVLDFVDLELADKYGRDPTPLHERRTAVLAVCKDKPNLTPSDARIISDPAELSAFYEEALAEDFEGLVTKDLNSPYLPTRSAAWQKLKPIETMEGTVVGFNPGEPGKQHEGRLGACQLLLEGGVRVNCGGGFRVHERDFIWQNKAAFMGLPLEFKYQPDPAIKARFLRFRRFRWDQVNVPRPAGYKGR